MTFTIDAKTFTAATGSFVFVPRGIYHKFWNAGDSPARQLIDFTPSGMEAFFEEVSAVLAAGGLMHAPRQRRSWRSTT